MMKITLKGLGKFVYVVFFSVILTTSYSTYPVFAQEADMCTLETVHDFVDKITANSAYAQIHTSSDHDLSTNTGPGDLGTPGEIRGQFETTDTEGTFEAHLNADNQVVDDNTLWLTVTALADIHLTLHGDPDNPDADTDHIEYEITFTSIPEDNDDMFSIENVVGLHIHDGTPTENSHIHLVDIIPTDAMNPQSFHNGHILSGDIFASDLCPMELHHHGGDDTHDGGDGGHDGGDECTATIAHLITQMSTHKAYLQFHTDNDGDASTNSGPGDLGSPGEVRGNIMQDSVNMHLFTANINAASQVLDDDTLWQGVTATGTATFTEMNHGGENHHIAYSIDIDLDNVVGIHIHNGGPTENNHIHLVDIKPTDVTDPITLSSNTPLQGMIMADDICPGDHQHGGDGGHDGGDGGHDGGVILQSTTVDLAGHVMQENDFFGLVDFGDTLVSGHLFLRIPCNADGLPLVMPIVGHMDIQADHTHFDQASITIVEHMSTIGKSCVYQSSTPGHDGPDKITAIGLLNACDRNVVLRTANTMSFTLNGILGDITNDPYHGESMMPDDGHTTIHFADGTHTSGDVCGLSSGSSGDGGNGGDDGHDHGSHDH